ncbi:MAG: hypothetical protein R3E86_02260 [Pseudomonadales bacterium]
MSSQVAELAQRLDTARTIAVISGAGLSGASGIATYRDDAGNWRRAAPSLSRRFSQNRRAGVVTGPAACSAGR